MPRDSFVRQTGGMSDLVHPSQLDPRLADLQRPQHSGFTAGLCRALAERWRVDPIIVRLVAVALTFAGGVGVALYAWGWLLTPRAGGQPPILRKLPVFGRWPQNTQAIVIAVSSLVLVLSTARTSGVAWGPVIVVAVLAAAIARKRSSASLDATPEAALPGPGPRIGAAPAAGESVEQWRARLGTHAGSPLPAVDLYAPDTAVDPVPASASRPQSRTSWWAGAAVLAVSATAFVIPVALGVAPALLWGCVAAGGTAAVSLLLWALVARNRRMPGALLALALVGAVGSGMLAVAYSQAASPPLYPTSGDVVRYSFVGEADAQLDLTHLAADTDTTVTIDATASVVEVRLNQLPATMTVNSDTIYLDRPSYRYSPPASELNLVIDGDFSFVELQVVP